MCALARHVRAVVSTLLLFAFCGVQHWYARTVLRLKLAGVARLAAVELTVLRHQKLHCARKIQRARRAVVKYRKSEIARVRERMCHYLFCVRSARRCIGLVLRP